jgi:hypothetical protein
MEKRKHYQRVIIFTKLEKKILYQDAYEKTIPEEKYIVMRDKNHAKLQK